MPSLPEPIRNVRFRHFHGEDDFPGMVAVLDAAKRADGIDRSDTVEGMRNYYSNLTNCDPLTDILIAETDEGIAGYSRVTWWIEEATSVRVLLHIGWVFPEVRGIGVGTAMLRWCEGRLREMVADKPHEGLTTFQSFYDDGETARRAVLEAEGYSPTQMYAEMTRSLSEPIPDLPLPEGIEIRPMTATDAPVVWAADKEAFRDHVGYSEPSDADYREFIGSPNFDPSLWKVAFDGGTIAGQVLNYVDRHGNEEFGRRRGYTESISVQRPWRGKGVARALIAESMRMFREMGMTEVALGVHTTNPTGAFRLYEGLGYRVVSRSHEVRKPFG
jgi:ribosomal protein S18 acetylase RimI-like enzyme